MNLKRCTWLGLLIAALIVTACGPKATPAPTASPNPTAKPLSPTAAVVPTATKSAPTVSEAGVPMGFTEDGLPYHGNPDAPVTLVEHSEFQ